jgi:TIR domain-containing protein
MDKNNIFISHASEDKQHVVDPFVECLRKHGLTNHWYDKERIDSGDLIIQRINEGLSTSKMGIIIFSISYLKKYWTTWELMVISTLLITHKIRMIPFMTNDISYEQIIEMYPILVPLKFEPIPSCEEIVSIVRRKLGESRRLIDDPTAFFSLNSKIMASEYHLTLSESTNMSKSESMERIDEKKLSDDYKDLKEDNTPEVKEMALTEISNYSGRRDFWNVKVSWEIMQLLIFSQDDNYRMRGIYILTEMLKKSIQVLGFNNQVVKNANELFGHKLLESIKPDTSKRISNDSLQVLEIILDYDSLFEICLLGLIDGIQLVSNDNESSNYNEKFVLRLERGSKEQISKLCEKLRTLAKTSSDAKVRKKALDLFNHFNKKTV